MEDQVQRLVEKTWSKFKTIDASHRLLIAVAGIPGSGKTTLAATVVGGLNAVHHKAHHEEYPNSPEADKAHPDPSQPDVAFAVPLDGYHLTRKQLSELPNAEEAVFRRGAEFTFDGQSYLELVERLRRPLEATTTTIYAPSFDHAKKDPVEHDIAIPPTARIIVFEGNYVTLSREPWAEAAGLMDELWFVQVAYDVATVRLVKRHIASGISSDPDHALLRVRESDMRNGREIMENKLEVQEVIKSVEDESWKANEIREVEEKHEQAGRPNVAGARKDSLAELAESGGGL